MNHEVISALIPKEYLKAFYVNGIRPDKRKLTDKRVPSIVNQVLESEKYSCSSSLGDGNRVIGVLQTKAQDNSGKIKYILLIQRIKL